MNANVGMQYPVYAKIASYTAGTGITYSAGAQAADQLDALQRLDVGMQVFHPHVQLPQVLR